MIAVAPLLAAFDAGLAKLIIFLIIMAIAGINQLIKMSKERQPRRPVRPEPNDARQRLERELEDFVRRAKGETAKAAPPPPPTPKPEKKRRRPSEPRRPALREESVEAAVVEEPRASRKLEPRLEQHIDTSRFEQRAKQLTNIAHEAVEMDEHVHQVFDHKLGQLGEQTHSVTGESAPERPRSTLADQLVATLIDPQSIQQAIVLQEVLTRPVHRW